MNRHYNTFEAVALRSETKAVKALHIIWNIMSSELVRYTFIPVKFYVSCNRNTHQKYFYEVGFLMNFHTSTETKFCEEVLEQVMSKVATYIKFRIRATATDSKIKYKEDYDISRKAYRCRKMLRGDLCWNPTEQKAYYEQTEKKLGREKKQTENPFYKKYL